MVITERNIRMISNAVLPRGENAARDGAAKQRRNIHRMIANGSHTQTKKSNAEHMMIRAHISDLQVAEKPRERC